MGGTYYIPDGKKYFAYPDYNTGYSKSVLLARTEDESIKAYDWRSMSGKVIGVYERAEENIRRLRQFMQSNGIDCTIREFTYEQLTDGKLFPYLENGEVDLILGNTGDADKEFRVVAEFDAQPHYIVTTPDNQEVLDGLNMAMEKIVDTNPNFAEERYAANFPEVGKARIFLNEEEKNYIEKKTKVSAAVVENWHPLYCMESDKDEHNGIIPDVLEVIQEFTGLDFTYVYAWERYWKDETCQAGSAHQR